MNITEVSFGIASDEDGEVALTYTLDLNKEGFSNFEAISLMALVISSHLHHLAPSLDHFKLAAETFKKQFDEYIALAEPYGEER